MLPDTVTPELVHVSHVSQHEPLTDRPTDYGYNLADVALGWSLTPRVSVTLADGYAIHRDSMPGPRETFTAKIGYTFTIRK